jgi:hypothetical protein
LPPARPWRYFGTRQVKAARAHAAAGGIAIHENLFKPRGHRTCHLLAPDEAALLEAGRARGLGPERVHRSNNPHFDLFGSVLALALARCEPPAP